jgi:simple sugar transport system ATP-binding protein
MNPAVQMMGITKSFSDLVANDNIDFVVEKGEIHGLLGENGAGKTVLMSTLYGLHKPNKGRILIDGEEVAMESPAVAIKHGVGMVHQHFMLLPSFTVSENIILGNEPIKNRVLIDRDEAHEKVENLSRKYSLEVDPDATIDTIPVGVQQRVEILKALYRGAEILILDEPTAILTPQEVDTLLKALTELKTQGKTIILISHKLKEVLKICDRITVLKKGKRVGTVNAEETSLPQLARMMVDRQLTKTFEKKPFEDKENILGIKTLQVDEERGLPAIRELSLIVHSHEILGIAGVEGNGQSELVEALMGLRKIKSGEILLKSKKITNLSTKKRIREGISHVPEDRIKRGLIVDFSVMENLILGSQGDKPFSRNGLTIDYQATAKFSDEMIKSYSISTTDRNSLARNLSGGTQQRVVIAREFSRDPKLIIAYQPSRGLDIGATEFVRSKLVEARDRGCAVLLISADLDEIRSLSDRIAVMYEGRIVAERTPAETNEEDLGLLMTGGKT